VIRARDQGRPDASEAERDGRGPAAGTAVPSTVHDLGEAVHRFEAEDRPPPAGTATNVLVALAVVALGLAALAGSLSLGPGTAREPDSGTWPLLVSAVLVALGVALALTATRTHDTERFSRNSLLVLAGLVTMVVFVAVIEVIGFELPSAALTFVWLRFLGHEGWRTSLVISVAVVVALYLVFVAALQVPVPHLF
jgi:hypothetical protein